ncbi:two-component system sensor histidine kinase YcbA [Aequitasia blattaphilus]|uniref:histidine kinase n=1 Tax=Aequitasia blattaphilus TaxID=2949332 RepID=A0ABT1E7F6_9FIRM|nr:sensor histidine kinase [Aequitasia blattaphilus]MCP1101765.1 sensor histidine kinase [Aequitasia blattaphilus]MCR8614405.1 sensor histidine kinase [Aequitasia blattaphilus]
MNSKLKKTFLLALLSIFSGLISMRFFDSDFQISVSVILILIFIYTMQPLYNFLLFALTGIGLFFLRIIVHLVFYSQDAFSCWAYVPEIFFYLTYGILFVLFHRLQKERKAPSLFAFLPIIFIDYGANSIELLIRMGSNMFNRETHLGILFVAFLRTFVSISVLKLIEYYKILLLKQEHEDRYKRILIFIARLNEELVWLKKNTELIEHTMSTSYQLYETLKTTDKDNKLAAMALSVSKDIHEIKKEYLLILRGLSVVLKTEEEADGMYIKDILFLIKDSVKTFADELNKELIVTLNIEENFYTSKHYLLLSVFRNLLVNALEAAPGKIVTMHVEEHMENGFYTFRVSDDGIGIPADTIDAIFLPGFSTKINYATGEVNRGLGLSLVQDMIEKDFKGEIKVKSDSNGTEFFVSLDVGEVV